MKTKMRLRRVILFVKDLKLMTEFYENKLGLGVLLRSDDFVDFDAGDCRLALHRSTVKRAGRTKICFFAENVSQARAELVARSVIMGKDPGVGEGLKLCDGRDPEGNIFQLSNRE